MSRGKNQSTAKRVKPPQPPKSDAEKPIPVPWKCNCCKNLYNKAMEARRVHRKECCKKKKKNKKNTVVKIKVPDDKYLPAPSTGGNSSGCVANLGGKPGGRGEKGKKLFL